MLYTNIDEADKYNYLKPEFAAAYQWLRETELNQLNTGEYAVTDVVKAIVMEYETIAAENARFESHEKYFDIQYMVSGRERFGISLCKTASEQERDTVNDIIFFEEPEEVGYVILKAGDMAVVAPEDLHKPKVRDGVSQWVKKIVIKIPV